MNTRDPVRPALMAVFLAMVLAGCAKSPAEQCLDSFRSKLKDPESGKVIVFEDKTLSYTATNSYGARIQGKALCKETSGKWSRDYAEEYLAALQYVEKVGKRYNDCMEFGARKESICADSPLARKFAAGAGVGPLSNDAAEILGFN